MTSWITPSKPTLLSLAKAQKPNLQNMTDRFHQHVPVIGASIDMMQNSQAAEAKRQANAAKQQKAEEEAEIKEVAVAINEGETDAEVEKASEEIPYKRKLPRDSVPFILAKVYDDDEESDWKNKGHQLAEDELGKEVYKTRLEEEFKDAMHQNGSSMISEINMKLKKTKIDLFYNSGTVTGDSGGLPRAVGGAGFLTIVNKAKFPKHPFFRAGRHFRMRLRHANLAFLDDAMLDGRVVCVKFDDKDAGGPLDLIFHTGRVSQFYNASSFEKYLSAIKAGENAFRQWTTYSPCHYYGRVENARREPSSYYDQRYYSHVTYVLVAEDGTKWWARMRLLPADGCQETGLASDKDQKQIWFHNRRHDVMLAKDYLREEYRGRLAGGPIQYRLQVQLREVNDDESLEALNPCKMWDRELYQWLDLAMLTVALPLPEEVIAKTKYSLGNHPPSLQLPPCQSVDDFCSLPYIISEFHGSLEKSVKELDEVDAALRTTYVITVVTGKSGNAGTDADVFIALTGVKGRTALLNLDNELVDDFEAGQTDVFEEKLEPCGEIIGIQVEMRSRIPGREWFLDYVTVSEGHDGKVSRFPCYKWLTTAEPIVLLRRAEAVLVQQEMSAYSYLQRKYELEERRRVYQWDVVEGMPSRIKVSKYDDLPKECKLHKEKEADLRGKYLRTLANTGVSTVTSFFDGWNALTDYQKLLTNVLKDKKTVKKIAQVWEKDEEFGRQFLNGVHPTRIRRLDTLTRNFPITDAMLEGLLGEERTLSGELVAGRLFILSYPELERIEGVINQQETIKRHVVSPFCLLHLRNDGHLVPVAIQLHQKGGPDTPVWTIADSEDDWLFAKMWVREADAQIHQIVTRHLQTHLVMEAMCVATMRNLPAVHPVYKLLIPHLRYNLAVNVLGRDSLYPAEDGLFQKYLATGAFHKDLVKEAYKTFDLNVLNIPKDIEERGVNDAEKLPNYYYRDDALELWRIIKKFVRTMLVLHYWTAENVRNDEEIQEWIIDIKGNGFPIWADGSPQNNVPMSFENLDELIEFVTMIIFTASCQNAALTGGMMDYYAFCPNIPTMLSEPPPQEKGQITRAQIMKALPSKTKTAEVIAAVYTLSRFSRDELYLGQYPNDHFDGEINQSAITAFQEDLKVFAEQINERNKDMEIPYTYLLPDRIPNSIAN